MFESASEDGAPFLFESMENQDGRPKTPESDDVDRTAHKRKLDKDGFVHPATPDIPKTSMQYSLPSFPAGFDMKFSLAQAIQEESPEDGDESESPLNQNQNESSQLKMQLRDYTSLAKHEQSRYLAEQSTQSGIYEREQDASCPDYAHLNACPKDDTNNTSQSLASRDFTFRKIDTDKCATLQTKDGVMKEPGELESLTTMEDLFKELSQEAKMVTQQFSSGFIESEEYEVFCMTRLDELIGNAQQLEQVYIKQKEVLRQRLRVISHTLQNM